MAFAMNIAMIDFENLTDLANDHFFCILFISDVSFLVKSLDDSSNKKAKKNPELSERFKTINL